MARLQENRFRGRSLNRIDEKGRLRLPKKYREVLREHYSDSLVITTTGRCLVAYPPELWEEIEEKSSKMSLFDPKQRAFVRHVISSAEECEFDKQGRILIPPLLRDAAGLNGNGDVMLAGMLTNFEIWEKGAWDTQQEWSKENYQDIAEQIAELGI